MANPPPLARRIELGALLRKYRDRANLDVAEVAEALGWSYVQKVGLVESGKRKLVATEVTALADLLKLTPVERAKVVELGKEARKRDPGPAFAADYAQTYLACEAAASHLKLYAEELLTGSLQTPDYARVILEQGGILAPDEIDMAIAQRSERQRNLTDPESPRASIVLSESSLRRMVGGLAVMRGQVDYIRTLSDLPNVTVQLLPFASGAHLALGTSFSLIHIGDPVVTFVYVESLADADFHDRPPHTEVYILAFDRAQRAALSPDDSVTLLDRIAADLNNME
jgi:hypothetical protein